MTLYNDGVAGRGSFYLDGALLEAVYYAGERIWWRIDPSTLFANNGKGLWIDPTDRDTMFVNADGTGGPAQIGGPVGRINDKSGNGHDFRLLSGTGATLEEINGVPYLNFTNEFTPYQADNFVGTSGMAAHWGVNTGDFGFCLTGSAINAFMALGASNNVNPPNGGAGPAARTYVDDTLVDPDLRNVFRDAASVNRNIIVSVKPADLTLVDWSAIGFDNFSSGLSYRGKFFGMIVHEDASQAAKAEEWMQSKMP